ncbi:cilia- and flagella-associated protein 161 [Drosophila eugracilis]|uniref:cilia- and flagella-associated protein 161 n=1 Tax=Drosophila eugracilis TaxID=29029 RepID=UPI0007E5FFAB|nr:cilia- and flagella-associated protein 161 [Drosophila eugracilis]XP_017081830.1 cilia- and flagella-associated protein 161 [Drosophila eugracilis]
MYSAGVKVGNWFEAALSEEKRVFEMKKRRESGNLLLDRTRAVYDRFYQETTLGPPQDVLAFGVVVQLRPVRINVCRQQAIDQNLVLSVVITQEALHRNCHTINEMCDLTVAPSPRPSLRNSFRIVSPNEDDRSGQYLAYGEKFRLQALEPADEPMYVFSGPKRLNLSLPVEKSFYTTKHGEVTLPLGLVSHKNCGPSARVPTSHTHFFCAHTDPYLRFEYEGKTIPVNNPLLIVHAVTNRNLAVENVLANTLFGPEFQVSVETYKNMYKRETWKNQWKFTY